MSAQLKLSQVKALASDAQQANSPAQASPSPAAAQLSQSISEVPATPSIRSQDSAARELVFPSQDQSQSSPRQDFGLDQLQLSCNSIALMRYGASLTGLPRLQLIAAGLEQPITHLPTKPRVLALVSDGIDMAVFTCDEEESAMIANGVLRPNYIFDLVTCYRQTNIISSMFSIASIRCLCGYGYAIGLVSERATGHHAAHLIARTRM